jgi:hypothetical protein
LWNCARDDDFIGAPELGAAWRIFARPAKAGTKKYGKATGRLESPFLASSMRELHCISNSLVVTILSPLPKLSSIISVYRQLVKRSFLDATSKLPPCNKAQELEWIASEADTAIHPRSSNLLLGFSSDKLR